MDKIVFCFLFFNLNFINAQNVFESKYDTVGYYDVCVNKSICIGDVYSYVKNSLNIELESNYLTSRDGIGQDFYPIRVLKIPISKKYQKSDENSYFSFSLTDENIDELIYFSLHSVSDFVKVDGYIIRVGDTFGIHEKYFKKFKKSFSTMKTENKIANQSFSNYHKVSVNIRSIGLIVKNSEHSVPSYCFLNFVFKNDELMSISLM